MTPAHYYDVEITGAVPESAPTSWLKRGPGQCAWPLGEGFGLLSCCAPVNHPGRPYCPAHHAASIRPAVTGAINVNTGLQIDAAGEGHADAAEINLILSPLLGRPRFRNGSAHAERLAA